MKFKLDESFPSSIQPWLVSRGHDCHSVFDEKLAGSSDRHLIEICRKERRHLLTQDLDFGDIVTYPPGDYTGSIVFRLARQDSATVLRRLGAVIEVLERLDLIGHIAIVSDTRIRFR